jgi:tetratricopeptide (TPR) repeat protein
MKVICASIFITFAFAMAGCQAKSMSDDLSRIANQIDEGNGDEVESILLSLQKQNPKNPEVLTLLARIEYLRAVSGLSQYPGMPPVGWDKALMDSAERRVLEATEMDPNHAHAWIVYGQIKYARYRLDESLKMLERAEAIDPSNVKLRLRKGATLRALASRRGDNSLLDASVREYQRAIKDKVDDGNERLAATELADVFGAKGEFDKALGYLSDALITAKGSEKAFILDQRAKAHLYAGHVDSAITDSHAALGILDFGVGRQTLALALLVKSGAFMREEKPAEAASYTMEAIQTGTDIGGLLPVIAASPQTFPAVFAFLEPRMKEAGGDQMVASKICSASKFISRVDLQRLSALGADLNVVDPVRGTLLHCAVEESNFEAVSALLELGVDANIRHPDGRNLLETTLIGTSPVRKEIRRLVLAKVGTPSGWKDPEVDLPAEKRWYKAERTIGSTDNSVVQAGSILLSGGSCKFSGVSDVCLVFYKKPGEYFGTVAIPLSRLSDLKALHEVPAPVE